jgi:hypothetical protein
VTALTIVLAVLLLVCALGWLHAAADRAVLERLIRKLGHEGELHG